MHNKDTSALSLEKRRGAQVENLCAFLVREETSCTSLEEKVLQWKDAM